MNSNHNGTLPKFEFNRKKKKISKESEWEREREEIKDEISTFIKTMANGITFKNILWGYSDDSSITPKVNDPKISGGNKTMMMIIRQSFLRK